VKKNRFFQSNFRKKSIFSGYFAKQILIFQGKFLKNFDFSGNLTKNISIFQAKFSNDLFSVHPDKTGRLQLLLGKLFYFSSKVTTFEHTFCTS